MNWWNVFLVICMWIFLPIVYVSMKNNTVSKKGLILSVTLPPEGQQDEEVQSYTAAFRKKLLRTVIWLTAAILPALFLPWVSVSVMWTLVWLPAAMFVVFWVYGQGYKGLKAIKRRRGWKTGSAGQAVTEVQELKLPKPVKNGWFVPPVILSVLPVISCIFDEMDAAWHLTLLINAVMCLGITVGMAVWNGLIFRQKPDVMDENPDRTAALTRVRRYNWTKTCLLMAWVTGIFSVAAWIGGMDAYLVLTLIYSAVIVVVSLMTEFAVRRAQQRLSGGAAPVVDEDDYWIWGQFYYNPHSTKVFIPERVGMGMNMNYATKAGKFMAGLTVVVLLALIPLGIWLMVDELSTAEILLTEETLTVEHGSTEYVIQLEEVTHAELLEELPVSSRIWGTGLEHLLKGSFSVEGYGTVKLCLDPHDPPFLLLETAEGTYLIGGKDVETIYAMVEE